VRAIESKIIKESERERCRTREGKSEKVKETE
jgi:hypothetical protein